MRQLEFTLALIDKVTRPLRQAQAGVTEFADKSRASFQRVAVGGAALWGVGQAIKGALGPAIEMYDALQEQSARGIDSSALKQVEKDANNFAMTYGKSAVEFVQSTSSINAAISGLTGTELPKVTQVANLMAAAVGSSAAESAEFLGQMFGNFREEAERLGKVQFAGQLADKMAFMRQRFGVEMGLVKDLMEGARGVGTNYGIGLNEQLAVMGELQRTLGSEASGAYEGFLTGAEDGAKKLGLSFTNSAGQMLSMPEILTKLQGKYGDSIAGNVEAQKALDDAFGDSSAVVKQLWGNVGTLQRNITELGGSDGLKRTQEMAAKMVKPWDRFMEILTAIRRVIGMTLIPVLYPLLNRLADMGQTFARWMQMFPNIARVVGYASLALLSLAGAGAVANIVMGVGMFVANGWAGIWKLLTMLTKIDTAWTWLNTKAKMAWAAVMRNLRGVLMALRMQAVLTGAAINFMSWPILLIIGAVALLAAGCYLLIAHWDAIKAAVMNTEAFQAVSGAVAAVAGVFGKAWAFISEGWVSFVALLSGFSVTQTLGNMASGIMNLFANLWDNIKKTALSSLNWVISKLNKIPGIDIAELGASVPTPSVMENKLTTGGQLKGVDSGGVSKTINSNSRAVTDNSRRIDKVEMNMANGMTPQQLTEWQELAG
ncbi:phage tail tape measure protein [Mixta mediterraneensis]|uniref:phage tail tape measure protein n=1 Tax=Mixta mediterraneensis TaxID=2758443 RepID=UPI001875A910|nr:phage tail tape measure protein [Mixta mediterraneensis]MBE5254174.1 phage tail tape measure protein [Mixta mediterraneensis]